MQILQKRSYPFIEFETLMEAEAEETLVREQGCFYLFVRSEGASVNDEVVIQLDSRDALLWLNETEDEYGQFWLSAQHDGSLSCLGDAAANLRPNGN